MIDKVKKTKELFLIDRWFHISKLFNSTRVRANLWRIGTGWVKDYFMSRDNIFIPTRMELLDAPCTTVPLSLPHGYLQP